jgi:hypothetical protein
MRFAERLRSCPLHGIDPWAYLRDVLPVFAEKVRELHKLTPAAYAGRPDRASRYPARAASCSSPRPCRALTPSARMCAAGCRYGARERQPEIQSEDHAARAGAEEGTQ